MNVSSSGDVGNVCSVLSRLKNYRRMLLFEEGRLRISRNNVGCVGRGIAAQEKWWASRSCSCHANKLNKVAKLKDKLNRVFLRPRIKRFLTSAKLNKIDWHTLSVRDLLCEGSRARFTGVASNSVFNILPFRIALNTCKTEHWWIKRGMGVGVGEGGMLMNQRFSVV